MFFIEEGHRIEEQAVWDRTGSDVRPRSSEVLRGDQAAGADPRRLLKLIRDGDAERGGHELDRPHAQARRWRMP
jgi:hypothetical protein